MTPNSQFFTGAVGVSMFKINWNSRKQANSIGVPLYHGVNYGSGECSGGVAAFEGQHAWSTQHALSGGHDIRQLMSFELSSGVVPRAG